MSRTALSLPAVREVHVWFADLDRAPVDAAILSGTLSPDERARAARFFGARLGERFSVGRGLLRTLLSAYLGGRPSEIRLSYGHFGKPVLERHPEVSFNVSASGRYFMAGFARDAPVGVDIEEVRPVHDMLEIADRFFAASEARALRGLPPPLHRRAFFNCWTRKEAYVKAVGGGLSIPLDGFEVSLDEQAELRSATAAHGDAAAWTLFAPAAPGPSTVAAVAVEAPRSVLIERRWSDLFR